MSACAAACVRIEVPLSLRTTPDRGAPPAAPPVVAQSAPVASQRARVDVPPADRCRTRDGAGFGSAIRSARRGRRSSASGPRRLSIAARAARDDRRSLGAAPRCWPRRPRRRLRPTARRHRQLRCISNSATRRHRPVGGSGRCACAGRRASARGGASRSVARAPSGSGATAGGREGAIAARRACRAACARSAGGSREIRTAGRIEGHARALVRQAERGSGGGGTTMTLRS